MTDHAKKRHHQDESLALACLFDCWWPKWKAVDEPMGFSADIRPAIRAFGFVVTPGSPFGISRMCGPSDDLSKEAFAAHEEHAAICTTARLRSPGFLNIFRRSYPERMILCVKSGLWWVVWDKSTPTRPHLYISTAEYLPRGKGAA